MRAILTAFVVVFVLAGAPVRAGEKAGDPGTNVEMPILIAPMTVDGRLTSYAYISTKVVTTSRSAALELRGKLPFVQDAFIRNVNATPIAKSVDPKTVDDAALVERLKADVRRIIGAAKIAAVVIVHIQIASLHPSQTPSQGDSGTPPG